MASIQQVLLAYGGSGSSVASASILHMNGTNGSTTFTDAMGKTWTASGNAQISTAQSQFGGASGLFDGSGDFVTGPNHADFGFGAGDFTVEMWVNLATASGDHCLFDNRNASNTGIAIYSSISGSGNKWGTSDNSAVSAAANILSTSTWVHLAVCREGTTLRLYQGGVQIVTATDSRTYASTATPILGTNYLGSQGYNGYMDEVRITKGTCRYPGGTTFTPTGPFPDI